MGGGRRGRGVEDRERVSESERVRKRVFYCVCVCLLVTTRSDLQEVALHNKLTESITK